MAPIPPTERSPLLKSIVFELYGRFARLIMENKSRAQVFPLRYMLEPWLNEKERKVGENLEARRAKMLSLGIDGASYVDRFQQVLEFDRHLRQCCGWVSPLIDHIDRHLATSLFVNLIGTSHTAEAEGNWDEFLDLTYASPLTRSSYTHLFNFKTDHVPLSLGKARIERLSVRALANILGEAPSAVSFFHRPAEAEYFLVFEESGWDENPEEWLRKKNGRQMTSFSSSS